MGMTLEQMAMMEPTEEQVWRQAQRDYEGGISVGEVCARYGLARSSVYQRAQLWRAAEGAAQDPDAPAPKAADLARTAWRKLGLAVEAGRIHEALCWRALLDTLEKRAAKEAWADRIKGMSQDEAVDELLGECGKTVAAETARRDAAPPSAPEASLDTLPPLPETPANSDAAEAVHDPETVRAWRAWAAVSDRLSELGEAEAPDAEAQRLEETAFAPGCGP